MDAEQSDEDAQGKGQDGDDGIAYQGRGQDKAAGAFSPSVFRGIYTYKAADLVGNLTLGFTGSIYTTAKFIKLTDFWNKVKTYWENKLKGL